MRCQQQWFDSDAEVPESSPELTQRHGDVAALPTACGAEDTKLIAAAADEVPEYAPELTEEERELVQGLQDCIDRARQRANKQWPPDVAQEMLQALLSRAEVGCCLVCTVEGSSTACNSQSEGQ